MKTYSSNGPDSNTRESLFPYLRFTRHGKTDPVNCRTYGKVCTLEGGEVSNEQEDAEESGAPSHCQFPGQSCSNRPPPKRRSMHAEIARRAQNKIPCVFTDS